MPFVGQVNYGRDALHRPRLDLCFFTFFYCWSCAPSRIATRGKADLARGMCIRAYPPIPEVVHRAGLALGGYPRWANGPDETPRCSECEERMVLLVQLAPSSVVAATWGDVGTVYLFMCARHTGRTTLQMQCT
jgi:hypothetical protein